MRLKNSKVNSKTNQSGFTLVELLIVIIVIAILAAITIVAYNGVTARANTTSAQAAASTALKKAEAFNAETNAYPDNPDDLTAAPATTSYNLTGVTFTTGVATGQPSSPSTLNFYTCTNGAAVSYYNYQTPGWVQQKTGACTGTLTYVTN